MGLFDEEVLEDQLARSTWKAPDLSGLSTRGLQHIEADTESTGLKWHEAGVDVIGASFRLSDKPWDPARPAEGCHYLPVAHAGGGNLDEGAVRRWMVDNLAGKDLYFLNAKHDVKGLKKFGVDLEAIGARVHDVSHQAALLNEVQKKYGLDNLARQELGIRKLALDHGALSGGKHAMGRKPACEVGPYAEVDVALLRGLRDRYAPRIEAEGLGRVLALEDRIVYAVVEMEQNAVRIDEELLDRWIAQTQIDYEEQLKAIRDVAGVVNPDSPGDMLKLFQLLHIPVEDFTEDEATGELTDTPSFADSVLARVEADPRFPEGARRAIGAARRAKALRSLRSKYLLKYRAAVGADGLLRYSLNQLGQDDHGTVTGRFSSTNVNIQQVFKPSKQRRKIGVGDYPIRRLFLPRRGRKWLAADARQIELRFAAHYAAEMGRTRLEDEYRKNRHVDFHDLVVDIREAASGTRPDRDLTKNFSFMRLFGGGVGRAMEMTGYDEATARRELDAYDAQFPEFKALMDWVTEHAKRRGYVRTILGRRRHFNLDKGKPRWYSGLNAVIQGGAGDWNKQKIAELYDARKDLDVHLMFTVHDEDDMDVDPGDDGRRVSELLDAQTIPFRVPILWEVATGPNWAELEKLK